MPRKSAGAGHLRSRGRGKNIKAELEKSKIDPMGEGYDAALRGDLPEGNPYPADKRPPPWDLDMQGEGPAWSTLWDEGYEAGLAELAEQDKGDAWRRSKGVANGTR